MFIFEEFQLAIAKHDLQKIQQIISAHVNLYHWFMANIFIENSDEILLSVLDKIQLDPHARGLERKTLIAKAARRGCLAIVDKLVAVGADVNLVPNDGEYPFCGAANGGYEDIFEYLLPLTKTQLKELEIPLFVERLKYRKQHHCFCYTTIVHSVADPVVNVKRRTNPVAKINLSRHPEREAALWMAAYWGDEFLADTLLAAGADGNCQIDYRPFAPDSLEPVLWKHGQNSSGKRDCKGLNPWRASYQALTPLMVAIASGAVTKEIAPPPGLSHARVIHLLIKAGADVNLKDCDGDTALNWAIIPGWTEIVEVLLEANAQIDTVNNIGYSALMLATYLNHTRIVEVLQIAGASTSGLDRVELIQAIEQTDSHGVQALLARGTTPNAYHYQGDSALKLAIITGQLEVCRLLIQAGADMEFVDASRRESALLRAVRQGNLELIELLIAANASLNVQGKAWGETALIEAVRYCNLEAVRLLVEAGADVNLRDLLGHAALYYVDCQGSQCSINDQTEMGMLLLDAGASYDDEHS